MAGAREALAAALRKATAGTDVFGSLLGSPARCQLLPLFFGEGSPTKIDDR